jgi:hypothetical protein
MKKIVFFALAHLFAAGFAMAEPASCEAQAVSKEGKPLAGAAKNAFMKKCEREQLGQQCASKAVDKNGKPLAGAAKNSFMKKCESGK